MNSSPSSIHGTDCSDDSMKNKSSCARQLDPVTAVGLDRLSHSPVAERLDELTFDGDWTDEVLRRAGAYFDVPAAVRRRTLG